jgi:hypothetical protein
MQSYLIKNFEIIRMASPVAVSIFKLSELKYNKSDKSISYNGGVSRFVTNPMLCVGTPVKDSVGDTSFTILKVQCDSTSPEKTQQNKDFWQGYDAFVEAQTDIVKPYLPVLRNDETLRLKVVDHPSVKIVDRSQNTALLSSIVANETYCKFIVEPARQIVRDTSRTLGIWVHYVLIKPALRELEESEESEEEEESGSDDSDESGSTLNDSDEESDDDSESLNASISSSSIASSASSRPSGYSAGSSSAGKSSVSVKSAHKPRFSNRK